MSLLLRLYYDLKPFVPDPLRLAFRRRLAAQMRSRSRNVWPIKRAAAQPPENWQGWPDGKKFALVLTHDVEGPKGVRRVNALADLESRLGFRSSFNFIPEGTYSVPRELRESLADRGFEVGVHDLHHDGKLYRSRSEFSGQAARINSYLKDWGASGFRSGFMHHNLEWLQDLDAEYDLSTFDTDPFEPQPDGVDTIFPFWVQGKNGRGFVEMPYTLPQDSTLFLFLEEPNIQVWKSKLDWIAENGGMALVNVHPDYLNFDNQRSQREFPARFYEEFLLHVKSKFDGEFWSALPRDVAAHARETKPERPSVSGKRVCMVSYSNYSSDNRVMRYAEALAARGDTVDVMTLGAADGSPRSEIMNGVNVLRLQRRIRNEKGKASYLLRILRFLCVSSAVLSWKHLRRPYDIVHVHNVPDFLVFSAWLPKLTGARVILDIHDILPEFFASKFNSANSGWYVQQLRNVEKASCAFADYVIIANHIWLDRITSRSVSPAKCSVVLNHVDQNVFYPRERTRNDGKLIAIFPGGLQEHQGLDIAIRAFATVVRTLPNAEFHIYGEGNMKGPWMALAKQLGLANHVRFFNPLNLHAIADKIADADVGLVPKRADTFGNEAYSTKIMEFMSQGIPVVASRTRIDTYYFNDSLIAFFESGNHEEMAKQIIAVLTDKTLATRLVANGLAYVANENWDAKKHEYFEIADNNTKNRRSPTPPGKRPPAPKDLVSA